MKNDYQGDLMEKVIAFDFDGVVNSYKKGWQGTVTIEDEPVEGIETVFKKLKNAGFDIVIFSCRALSKEGKGAIIYWLIRHSLINYVTKVTAEKPIAKCYVDDRAIAFNGDTKDLVAQIMNFKSYLGD